MPYTLITGTPIGDMTDNGGLAAAFDGETSETRANSAKSTTDARGYIGLTPSSAKNFAKAFIYGSSDQGFRENSNPSVTINIRGKNGAAPSNRVDGTVVGTITFTDTADESAGREITSSNTTSTWDHLFAEIDTGAASGQNAYCAELKMYSGNNASARAVFIA